MQRFITLAAVTLAATLWNIQPAAASDCTRTHSGRVALTDLGTGTYLI